jgi:hypothetical protein
MANGLSGREVVDRLIRDNPPLHYISELDVQICGPAAEAAGHSLKVGPVSWAVPAAVLMYFRSVVKPGDYTIETGCGHSTVALAALGKHHICICPLPHEHRLVQEYMDQVGVPRDKVTFVLDSSEQALPNLKPDHRLNFAFIDGCHGYPFAALDWHYIDPHLAVGGMIGFDNTEIRAVQYHCDFLEANESYELAAKLTNPAQPDYGASFFRKRRDEHREWMCQPFNLKRPLLPGASLPAAAAVGRLDVLALKMAGAVRRCIRPLRRRIGGVRQS